MLTDEQIESEGQRQFFERLDLDQGSHVQDAPYWACEDWHYHATESVGTTKQYEYYNSGDMADSTGDDMACVGRDAMDANRLRARAQAYIDACVDDDTLIQCRIVEGYWIKGRIGQVIENGDYRLMIVGTQDCGEECELYDETGASTDQYYHNGPTHIEILIPVLTER